MSTTQNSIVVNNRHVGTGHSPYIIAEMACAHNGNISEAEQLIQLAREANADAVQLQFFVPDYTVTPQHEVYEILQKIAFSPEEWRQLFTKSKNAGLDVWICTYDLPSVKFAIELGADGIKLNSADLSNPEMISAVANSKIPFTLGTGASTIEEIQSALAQAEASGAKNLVLMQGVQNFPTAVENLNIARLHYLKKAFAKWPVGYADHTDAQDTFSGVVDLIALGAGACLFEKHIVLDRSKKGLDSQAALELHEFKNYVALIRKAYTALGSDEPRPFTESDLRYRKFQKKSIVAAKAIEAGRVLAPEDLVYLRNVTPGLAPIEVELVLGKKTCRFIEKFQNVTQEDVL